MDASLGAGMLRGMLPWNFWSWDSTASPEVSCADTSVRTDEVCSTLNTAAQSSPCNLQGTPESTHADPVLPVPDDSQNRVINIGNPDFAHRKDLWRKLLHWGFEPTDVFHTYCKVNFKARKPEYAWVGLETPDLAQKFRQIATAKGYKLGWVQDPRKLLDLQSKTGLKQWFENNTIMHRDITRSDLKPCFYEAGKEVPLFPNHYLKAPSLRLKNDIEAYCKKHCPNVPPEEEDESSLNIKNTFIDDVVLAYTETFPFLRVHMKSVRSMADLHSKVEELWNSGKLTLWEYSEFLKGAAQQKQELMAKGIPIGGNSW